MELSILQEALIHYLKELNLEERDTLAISLMLWKSEDGIKTFIYLSHRDKVSTMPELLMLATAIVQQLPPEERTGEVMNLRMKL